MMAMEALFAGTLRSSEAQKLQVEMQKLRVMFF